jgi:uncharacterized membrane protein YhaH (DUF805 family)
VSESFYSSSKGRLLFGLRGRIPRTDFWVGLVMIGVITTLGIFVGGQSIRGGGLGQFFAVVKIVAVLSPLCLIAVAVKRLHDLDKSGWYALTLVVLPFLLAAIAAAGFSGLQDERVLAEWRRFWTIASYVSAGLAAALFVGLVARLGFTRGTPGPNRFGPDPLALQDESVSETEAST